MTRSDAFPDLVRARYRHSKAFPLSRLLDLLEVRTTKTTNAFLYAVCPRCAGRLTVHLATNRWRCWNEGRFGDPVDLLLFLETVEGHRAALDWLEGHL